MLKHLRELMVDAVIYGWEPVRAFHAVSLQQLENGRAEWGDEEKKLEFRRTLVWNLVHRSSSTMSHPLAETRQNAGKESNGKSVPAKLGT